MSAGAAIECTPERLYVRGALDFDSVTGVEAGGIAWLTGPAPTRAVVDLSGVEYGNSAGIALLLSWSRAARGAGRRLMLEGMPTEMQRLAALGGLESLLGVTGE